MLLCKKLNERWPEYFDELGNYRPWEQTIEDGYKVPLSSKLSVAATIDRWETNQKAKGTNKKFGEI